MTQHPLIIKEIVPNLSIKIKYINITNDYGCDFIKYTVDNFNLLISILLFNNISILIFRDVYFKNEMRAPSRLHAL